MPNSLRANDPAPVGHVTAKEGSVAVILKGEKMAVWELEYGKPGPQISMEYQTPNQTAVNETNFTDWKRWEAVDGGRAIPFTLRNESEIAAYNVQVGNISLAGNTATFE